MRFGADIAAGEWILLVSTHAEDSAALDLDGNAAGRFAEWTDPVNDVLVRHGEYFASPIFLLVIGEASGMLQDPVCVESIDPPDRTSEASEQSQNLQSRARRALNKDPHQPP